MEFKILLRLLWAASEPFLLLVYLNEYFLLSFLIWWVLPLLYLSVSTLDLSPCYLCSAAKENASLPNSKVKQALPFIWKRHSHVMQYTCLSVWQSFEAPHTRVEPRLQISNALNQSALRSKVSIKLGTAVHNLVIGWYPFSANRHTIRISLPDSNPIYLNTICWWDEPVKEWPHEGFRSTTGVCWQLTQAGGSNIS